MDRITGIGYWYHDCPVTKQQHRIGFNYKRIEWVKRGLILDKSPYKSCFRCGMIRPIRAGS